MKKLSNVILLTISVILISCGPNPREEESKVPLENAVEASPKQMLNDAYQLFKEGDDEASIKLANEVLDIGRETKNDTLIGRALTSLCRNAQRKQDTTRLAELSSELVALTKSSGNKQWLMYRAHMNAEMWRLIGDMDRAEAFYNESLSISHETGATGMYTIDHFNKSFVSTAKGDFDAASDLIARYYELRKENGMSEEDAYGLIALAYLLEQKENYKGAHEVAVVTRRLFKEQNLFPEPPDEKPLLMVEAKVKEELDPRSYKNIAEHSVKHDVASLLEKFLK